ncbi:MAG TPA: N-methyl-L-tryptophan oxidase [Streptosporangiaceae bacterium]|nr:N-methyl-L-tryptophan oxidase [Streptosporangiaceae bacterium]
MSDSYDVIVIGLGGMGSAAAYRLAQRGLRVLGLDRHPPVHDQGSSHGSSRITRQAYFEDPAYVPLLLRAAELWPQIEADSGRTIVLRTGGLMVGPPDSRTVAGSVRSAQEWNLPHEVLDAAEIRRRFPTMTPEPGEIALYERGAGLVIPEESVAAHLALAARAGAELHHEEPATGWRATPGGGVEVTTPAARYQAAQLAVCPGPWAPELLAGLGIPFGIERQVQYWWAPAAGPDRFRAERHPIYIWEAADGRQFYGFPSFDDPVGRTGDGVKVGADWVKVAMFRGGHVTTPETIDRTVHPEEIAAMHDFVAPRMPDLPGTLLNTVTCRYTNTPDEHFVIARHPGHEQVVVACGFSGHGFKFVPVVGEIVADLVTEGRTKHPIGLFDPARFGPGRSALR